MELPDITLRDALLYIFGGGSIAGLIHLLKFISDRYDIARKSKKETEEEKDAAAIEKEKLDLAKGDQAHAHLWRLIEAREAEINRLSATVGTLQKSESLSQPTITAIYRKARELRRHVDEIEWDLKLDAERLSVIAKVQAMRAALDALEEKLP